MTDAVTEAASYEENLHELENRIQQLERGDLSLEEALRAVEEGRVYLGRCHELLNQAERRITISPEGGDDEGPDDEQPPLMEPPDVDPDDIPF